MQSALLGGFRPTKKFFGDVPPVIYLLIVLVWAVSIATILIGGYYLYKIPFVQKLFDVGEAEVKEKNIWEPWVPSPLPLAHGKQTYRISGSQKEAPEVTEAIIDPLDPATGTLQKVTIKTADPKKVKEVYVTLVSDNKMETQGLKLITGTNQDGTWEGSWKINDSYDYKYRMILKAKNEANLLSSVTLTFR